MSLVIKATATKRFEGIVNTEYAYLSTISTSGIEGTIYTDDPDQIAAEIKLLRQVMMSKGYSEEEIEVDIRFI